MKRKPRPTKIKDRTKRMDRKKTKPNAIHFPTGFSKLARSVLKSKGLWVGKEGFVA